MSGALNDIITKLYKLDDEDTIAGILSDRDSKEQKNDIFNYLKDKYNELTEMRKNSFVNQCSIVKEIELYEKELIKMNKKINELKQENSTFARKVERQNYERKLFNYHLELYKIIISGILVCLLISIISYAMASYNSINMGVLYLLVVGICVAYFLIIIYVVYYLTYNLRNRNKFRFDKL